MARLTYLVIMSVDGYVADIDGSFDWAAPDEQVHAFVNDLARPVGTYLYGRGIYEVMAVWETDPDLAAASPATRDFAGIWRAADKVVFSTTLQTPWTRRTRVEPLFDPDQVAHLVAAASADVAIGGPTLAGHALRAGLVDLVHTVVVPSVVGGGLPAFPLGLRLQMRLVDQRTFPASGVVYAGYQLPPTPLTRPGRPVMDR